MFKDQSFFVELQKLEIFRVFNDRPEGISIGAYLDGYLCVGAIHSECYTSANKEADEVLDKVLHLPHLQVNSVTSRAKTTTT